MTEKRTQPSVITPYAVSLLWILAAVSGRVGSLVSFLVLVALSVGLWFLCRSIFKEQTIEVEVPAPKPQDPELAALMQERDRAVGEMQRLNENIDDPVISQQIDHIEQVTGKIFDQILADPARKPLVRRFFDYYLPTTLKLLNQYDRMDSLGVDGEHINASKQRIRDMLGTVTSAFDRQLDSLFQDDAMDISADITVLEQMMAQEGLTEDPMHTQQTRTF